MKLLHILDIDKEIGEIRYDALMLVPEGYTDEEARQAAEIPEVEIREIALIAGDPDDVEFFKPYMADMGGGN